MRWKMKLKNSTQITMQKRIQILQNIKEVFRRKIIKTYEEIMKEKQSELNKDLNLQTESVSQVTNCLNVGGKTSFTHILVKNHNSKNKEKNPKCFHRVGESANRKDTH